MNSNSSLYVALVAVVIAILACVIALSAGGPTAAGSGSRFPNGISADATSPSVGQVRGATLTTTGAATLGGNLTVTTSNTATSSVVVGCLTSYATSTATPGHYAPTTATISTSTFAGTSLGVNVAFIFGACPF